LNKRYDIMDGVGVEIEYMIVDKETLDVRPIADKLIQAASGSDSGDYEKDGVGWSNEFVLHLVEFKTLLPEKSLHNTAQMLHNEVSVANEILSGMGATLMSGAAHPWMDPLTQLTRWPHDCHEIYDTYHRIFNSHQHGYANVQSVHMNIPFDGDEQFGRLCAATRMVMPLIPGLAAASPFVDGKSAGAMDFRMMAYIKNSIQVPQMAGDIIPEPVFTIGEYHEKVLAPLYAAIAPHDPDGVMAHEWLNARGAIPRFDRSALEIRVIDVQENPYMDAAVMAAVYAVIMSMVEERWIDYDQQRKWASGPLRKILQDTIKKGDEALVTHSEYMECFGVDPEEPLSAGELWLAIIEDEAVSTRIEHDEADALEFILTEGTLASRLMLAAGPNPGRKALARVYGHLCEKLVDGTPFLPGR